MKIVHVVTTINRGGAENQLLALVKEQVAIGAEVVIAFLKGDGYWATAFKNLGVRIESLGLQHYGELAPIWKLLKIIRATAPNLVHAHMPPAELYTRIALMLQWERTPLIISKHNDEPFYNGFGESIIGRWVARRAAHVIAISNAVKFYTTKHLGIPRHKISAIHYGIENKNYISIKTNVRDAVRSYWGVSPEHYVIGSVGRLVPQKAQHVLINAYAKYCATERQDSRLVIVGRGKLESQLKEQARKLGLEGKVIWAGFREDIPAVMNAFDVFSLTSSYEGFGLVLLEAMAAGCPVVASRVSAIPEVVQNGLTGILCEAGCSEEFANAFLKLEDTTLRESLGAAGQERVVSKFNISHMAKQTQEIYSKYCI